MKLQVRNNLNYLLFSAIIYIIVAGSFYLAVEYVIYEEVDKRLLVEKGDFEHFVDRTGFWDASCYFVEDKIVVANAAGPGTTTFADTLLLSRYDAELVPFRQVSFYKEIGNSHYKISIRKSLIESNQLLKIITIVMLVVLSGGLSLLYLVQQRTSKKLWKPFYDTLAKAKTFDVNTGEKLTLDDQLIFEFNELNTSLNRMTEKIISDYQGLREFTENASHEIQTPLALINSRVEGLIQDPAISDRHMRWIQDIHESALRLSKLNHALLLLTKIDNGQFYDTETVNFSGLVRKRLQELDEVLTIRNIRSTYSETGAFIKVMNRDLADVLVTNVLNNAVKHNLSNGGTIGISMASGELTISNTGPVPHTEPSQMFERFKRQNLKSNSLGLGLALVKKICEASRLGVAYRFENELHVVVITHLAENEMKPHLKAASRSVL